MQPDRKRPVSPRPRPTPAEALERFPKSPVLMYFTVLSPIEPYNTHVFVDVLAEKLIALGVTTEIVNNLDCESMSCAV